MTGPNTWQGVQEEVRRRIRSREWKPGELIPTETDLACELGCARTTVNRALRELAEAGLIERRRKSGTRVARHPTGRAVIEIPLIRREVEATGARYGYALLSRAIGPPPARVAYALGLPEDGAHAAPRRHSPCGRRALPLGGSLDQPCRRAGGRDARFHRAKRQ